MRIDTVGKVSIKNKKYSMEKYTYNHKIVSRYRFTYIKL